MAVVRSASRAIGPFVLHYNNPTYRSIDDTRRAGHDIALLIGAHGRQRNLSPTGTIVETIEDKQCHEKIFVAVPNDWLIPVTAGVVRVALSAIAPGIDDPSAHILEAACAHGGRRILNGASVLFARFS